MSRPMSAAHALRGGMTATLSPPTAQGEVATRATVIARVWRRREGKQ